MTQENLWAFARLGPEGGEPQFATINLEGKTAVRVVKDEAEAKRILSEDSEAEEGALAEDGLSYFLEDGTNVWAFQIQGTKASRA